MIISILGFLTFNQLSLSGKCTGIMVCIRPNDFHSFSTIFDVNWKGAHLALGGDLAPSYLTADTQKQTGNGKKMS